MVEAIAREVELQLLSEEFLINYVGKPRQESLFGFLDVG